MVLFLNVICRVLCNFAILTMFPVLQLILSFLMYVSSAMSIHMILCHFTLMNSAMLHILWMLLLWSDHLRSDQTVHEIHWISPHQSGGRESKWRMQPICKESAQQSQYRNHQISDCHWLLAQDTDHGSCGIAQRRCRCGWTDRGYYHKYVAWYPVDT